MRVIRPHVDEVVKVTCSCGCEDYIQLNRYLDSYNKDVEEDEKVLYHLEIKHDAKEWPLKIKLRELWQAFKNPDSFRNDGKNEYYNYIGITFQQSEKLFTLLKEDIEHFDEKTADYILLGVEDFSPIDKRTDEYTQLISNFNCDLMWIGVDGAELESPPSIVEGWSPYEVKIGWRFDEHIVRKDVLYGWRYFLKTGHKYNITTFDALLGKEDIITLLGSLKYIKDVASISPGLKGVVKL